MTDPPWWWFSAAVQVATTVLSVAAGVLIVTIQLRRQHEAALEEQRAQSRQQLHMEVYKDIAARLGRAGRSVNELNTTIMILLINFRFRRQMLDQHGVPITMDVSYSPDRLIRESSQASGDLISVLSILEDYEIAFSGFDAMHKRFAQKIIDLTPLWGNLHDEVAPFLVTPIAPAPPIPDHPQIADVEKAANELQQVLYDLMGFAWDVRVAAQNHLLADLFPGARVPERRPEDPRFEVLRPIYGGTEQAKPTNQ